MPEELPLPNLVELATDLTVAWLANPNTRADPGEVGKALGTIHAAISALGADKAEAAVALEPVVPAVSVRRSLSSPDHIISLIDGKPYKALRRHLSTHGLTPEDYRQRYGLKKDYPMVAPSYASARSAMAKAIGLGRKPGEPRPTPEAAPPPAPAKRRGRPPKTA